MINRTTSISIVGGGIGGLVAAIALRKKGFAPIVYEKVPQIRPIGSGLVLSSNAMNAMAKIGLSKAIISRGHPVHTFYLNDNKGTPLSVTDFDSLGKRYGHTAIGISRTDLQNILLQSLPSDTVILDHEFKSIAVAENKASIKFNGKPQIETDIVIGVDGLHSRIREQLFGGDFLRYSGQSGWRGLGALPNKYPLNHFFEYWGNGQRFGAVQINAEQVYWYVGLNAPANTLTKDGEASKLEILNLFKGWHDPITELIEKTDGSQIIHTDIYDAKPCTHWHKHNVVLLGDAIHPTTPNLGQGAGMAIESAITLAHCLANSETIKTAFCHFEMQRKKRTSWVTAQSKRFGTLSQLNSPWMCCLRNKIITITSSIMPTYLMEYSLKKLIGYELEF